MSLATTVCTMPLSSSLWHQTHSSPGVDMGVSLGAGPLEDITHTLVVSPTEASH